MSVSSCIWQVRESVIKSSFINFPTTSWKTSQRLSLHYRKQTFWIQLQLCNCFFTFTFLCNLSSFQTFHIPFQQLKLTLNLTRLNRILQLSLSWTLGWTTKIKVVFINCLAFLKWKIITARSLCLFCLVLFIMKIPILPYWVFII